MAEIIRQHWIPVVTGILLCFAVGFPFWQWERMKQPEVNTLKMMISECRKAGGSWQWFGESSILSVRFKCEVKK